MTGNQLENGGNMPGPDASPARQSGNGARIDPVVAVAIAGIAIACLAFGAMVYLGSTGPAGRASPAVVPAATCGERTLAYINANLVVRGTAATLASVNESHGVYLVTVDYQGDIFPFYVSPDCTILFRQSQEMATAGETPRPTPTPVKSDRPAAKLYVMSFCPYGKQAETAMKPVADLLGGKADIRVLFITHVSGTTISNVSSLHGAVEAQEDLRQVCIEKTAPGRFWQYVDGFNAACFGLSGNATAAAACSRNVSTALGISGIGIDACVAGAEGIALLSADEASAKAEGATASPTLFINGVRYSGARTAEAIKQGICGSFTSPPAECGTNLSTQQAAASGSC